MSGEEGGKRKDIVGGSVKRFGGAGCIVWNGGCIDGSVLKINLFFETFREA